MRSTFITLAVCTLLTPAFASDASKWLGTWKLNTEKSKFEGVPATKEETVTFQMDGNKIKRLASGTDVNGKTLEGDGHFESFPWDGEPHVVRPLMAQPR